MWPTFGCLLSPGLGIALLLSPISNTVSVSTVTPGQLRGDGIQHRHSAPLWRGGNAHATLGDALSVEAPRTRRNPKRLEGRLGIPACYIVILVGLFIAIAKEIITRIIVAVTLYW